MFILYNKFLSEDISSVPHHPWLDELPNIKRRKINALTSKQDQHRCLIGNQLLKTGMRLLGETDFRLDELEYTAHGKPYTRRPVFFSISHADDLVCCALSNKDKIGIDTELRTKTQHVELARYFSEEELKLIRSDASHFPDLWTRKEAICKAHDDKGLVDIPEIRLDNYSATLHNQQWWVYPVDLHHTHITHIACNHPVSDLTICEIDI